MVGAKEIVGAYVGESETVGLEVVLSSRAFSNETGMKEGFVDGVSDGDTEGLIVLRTGAFVYPINVTSTNSTPAATSSLPTVA